ncbi:MAG: hypothetical protein WAT35_15325 [Tabrizicola sp.]|jgi:hypothetical protein
MTDDEPTDDDPQSESQKKEPILFNWIVTLAGLGAITLVAVLWAK